jgi:diadenylate cyclase
MPMGPNGHNNRERTVVNRGMGMEHVECDVSPMKEQIKRDLQEIVENLQQSISVLADENNCLLGKLEEVKEWFTRIEAKAASFYLQCYLGPYTDTYMDLTIAIRHLSERRHGALIVVQRNDPLDRLIQAGVPIGASLSHSLLESLFYPGSPLHDGAVLVRANRIVSAGNVLPLSRVDAGGRKLGTRHRAAIGLTEQSDALVLVVSEETGKTSFAFKGKLYPIMTGAPVP